MPNNTHPRGVISAKERVKKFPCVVSRYDSLSPARIGSEDGDDG